MVARFGGGWLLFALVVLLRFLGASNAADSWQGKVIKVVDGETLDIAKTDGQVGELVAGLVG